MSCLSFVVMFSGLFVNPLTYVDRGRQTFLGLGGCDGNGPPSHITNSRPLIARLDVMIESLRRTREVGEKQGLTTVAEIVRRSLASKSLSSPVDGLSV